MLKNVILFCTLLLLFFSLSGADLYSDAKNADVKPESKKSDVVGWNPFLSVSTSFILNDNRNIVGQTDGTAMTLGLNLEGKMDYYKNSHEWRNSLLVKDFFSYTPELERFVKTTDVLQLETIYLYHVGEKWGPFAQASLTSSIFKGYSNTAADQTYLYPDASTETTDKLRLTDMFSPLTLKESLGMFFVPYKEKYMKIELKGGAGALQVFADDNYTLGDENDNGETVLEPLKSYNQLGTVFSVLVSGEMKFDSTIVYKLGGEVITPIVYDDEADRGSFELTNFEFFGDFSTKISSWLSIQYNIKAQKQPQLIDEWQIQNNLLLSISYIFID